MERLSATTAQRAGSVIVRQMRPVSGRLPLTITKRLSATPAQLMKPVKAGAAW
jgi:hypothetical protein